MNCKRLTIILITVLLTVLNADSFAGSQSFGNIALTDIAPRIFTPNSDLRNDKVFFRFDTSLTGIPVESAVYDLSGAKINTLTLDLSDQALSWDGKDNVGRSVPSGVYVYQIVIGKKSVSGSVVVAK